ncbi:filamentous hemagglutinin N-terminal domain-containing protein [Megasphaera elsdenii]|uniref:Filamentous hemagglutinin N-terminal domain-containing protein n=2 Tax=Megasphaera elsdenii TaxID=907 RepID=A0A2S0M9U7_MEGEL|nr:filamentous hemagglutinin N-terminal domain-containing protein [Megasphaera elsdenii]
MKGTKHIYMKYYSKKQWTQKLTIMVFLAMALGGTAVQAMPSGADIRSGQGSISQDGKNMTVQQNSQRMAIDWTKFDIAKDETVRYAQPDRNAISLNRVTGGQQSVIAGNLNANGNVVLVNPNGVVFTKNSSVDVGGLVASTARLNDEAMKNFSNGKDSLGLSLDKDSTASVINEGQIKAQGGLVALHAANVENKGTITNEGGTLAMAAAKNLTLSAADDDKLNFTVDGELAKSQALNSGSLKADGGYVVMTAKSAGDVLSTVVNNTGTIEAKTLCKNEKGQILLDGGDNGQVEVSGTLDASGTEEGQSAGNIKVIGQKTIVHDDTNLIAKGNVDGGKIETSGDVLNLGDNLNIDAKGVNGKAGEWLLDPLDVIIADKNPTTTSNYDNADKKTAADSDFTHGSASIGYNDPAATDANASSVNSAVTWISTDMVEKMLNTGTSVTVQAAATNGSANIIVKNDIEKTAGKDVTFTLDAMRNITINGNISSTSNKLNVVLNADSNGDKIGAVIINANINTNGGNFTSASGGTVTYAWDKDNSDKDNTKGYGKGKLDGKADPAGHTVGTYFGHVNDDGTADGKKDDRLIQTKGGKITLNGEIAIGLNGGTLTLDSGGGAVTATGIINSGNSYGAYVYGTDTWNTLVEDTLEQYLKDGKVPAYHYRGVNYVKDAKGNYVKNKDGTYQYTTDAKNFSNGQPHYTFSEADTQNVRWLGDGSSTSVSTSAGTGYASVVITKGSMTLKQWLNYQLNYNAANFAKRYISQSSGVKVVTATSGGKTTTSVQNSTGKTMTTADLQSYITMAVENFQNGTASTDTTLNGQTLYANIKDDISHLLATNWFASKELAQGNTKGGSAARGSYLATITTILENSLTTPNGQQILWAGGRGSGVLNKKGSTSSANDKLYPYSFYGMPDDPTYQDGMYWVTGPEGEANGGKGTQFYSNAGSDWRTVSLGSDGKTYTYNQGSNVYGYVNWDTWPGKAIATDKKSVTVTRSQPDNSAPFLTVGYGTTGKWDDAAMGGDTTVGFIKETNLANSSLNIKAGGTVNLEGDLGKAKALDTVNIESTGAVTVGTDNNNVTDYYHGTIYVDHGLYISGNGVKVGGEVHSGGTDVEATRNTDSSFSDYLDNVTINSAGNLTVHGIEVNASTDPSGKTTSRADGKGGKIKLTSTGTEGTITLGDGVDYNGQNTNGGVLKATSTANDAVVIDAQGKKSKFVNETTSTKAIDTQGKWKIYSASPEQNTFGKNLNSETDAQWTSDSTKFAANGSDKNKFIFQATPVITLYTDDYLKTYGDEVSPDTLNNLLKGKEAFFTGLDGKSHNVNEYSSAFKEKGYTEYISGADTVTVTSDGSTATATRTGGKYEATDKSGADHKNAVYDLTVNLNDAKALDGYAIDTENGKLEIKKRSVTITSSGEQTYGDSTYTSWTDKKSGFANGDEKNFNYEHGIKSGSAYENNLNKTNGRTTADAGEYTDSVSYSNPTISGKKNADGTDDTDFFNENYTFDTDNSKGSIKVNKAPLHIYTEDVVTPYGIVRKTQSRATGLTNGDEGKNAGFSYDYGDYGHGYLNGNTMTNQPGSYPITTKVSGLADDLMKNYDITIGEATLHITPLKPDQTTHYVEGAHRPQDKLESALPVFRVDASGVVKQYGTYGIESQSQAVTLSPTGMRMPEPNQTSTQDRKYLTTLKTAHGHGTFRLEYNGVVLRVIPVDPAAEQIVEAGDKLKNVALSEQALHAAYTQMGLDLVNLKGVYIYMAPM